MALWVSIKHFYLHFFTLFCQGLLYKPETLRSNYACTRMPMSIPICGSLSSGLFFHSVPGPGVVDA